jgi:hypothetical protein
LLSASHARRNLATAAARVSEALGSWWTPRLGTPRIIDIARFSLARAVAITSPSLRIGI